MFPHLQLNITAQMPEIGVLCNEEKNELLLTRNGFFLFILCILPFSLSPLRSAVSHIVPVLNRIGKKSCFHRVFCLFVWLRKS